MSDIILTAPDKLGLRAVALASAAVVFALGSTPQPASAQPSAPTASFPPPAGPSAPAIAQKLFPDSRMVVRDRISVEVVGAGPDIVMIPGLASSRETWRRTAERLRGRYRVHLVQVAGFAGEPARDNASGPVFEPVLADIDAYCASLPKPPVVMGHSLGGTLGLALAEQHPQHLSRLLIVDSLPFFGVVMGGPSATPDTVRPMVEQMRKASGAMPEAQTRAMMASMVTAPADVDRVVAWSRASTPAVVGTAMAEDATTDLRPGLAAVKTPVTVLYESQLGYVMKADYAPLGPKTLVEVPDSKHFIMFDQPARFDSEVDAFLKR